MTQVRAQLEYEVVEPVSLLLQVAVAGGSGHFDLRNNGAQVQADQAHGGQWLVRGEVGRLTLTYQGEPPLAASVPVGAVDWVEAAVALRPSRYCPADRVAGFAFGLFGRYDLPLERVRAIYDYVAESLTYSPGSSDANTDAVDTLLSRAGVCRDYAHLMAMLCRAMGVPARVASVYAPGLDPMDFHLVAETLLDDQWYVWDATRLAPRQSLVRIATGRDAADVAFGTVLSGNAELETLEIIAITDGDLPIDDHQSLVRLP